MSTERPTWMEELVSALGATPVEYRNKMQCCGAGGGVRGYDIVHALDIANEKLINLKEAKVDALTDICPSVASSLTGANQRFRRNSESRTISRSYISQNCSDSPRE